MKQESESHRGSAFASRRPLNYAPLPLSEEAKSWVTYDAVTLTWEAWENFDLFVDQVQDSKEHSLLMFLRNHYAAQFEMRNLSRSWHWDVVRSLMAVAAEMLLLFVTKPSLSVANSEKVLLVRDSRRDSELAEKIGLQPVVILHRKFCLNLDGLRVLPMILRHLLLAYRSRMISRRFVLNGFAAYIRAIKISRQLEIGRTKFLLTSRDRYPEEQALILRLHLFGGTSMLFDVYKHFNRVNQNTVFASHYFCPNLASRENYEIFPQNKSTIYINGGFPAADSYGDFEWKPDQSPRIITFGMQYGYSEGYLGRYPSSFYVAEILAAMPAGFVLWIKAHPLDDPRQYHSLLTDQRVRLLKPGEISNEEIFSRSTFVASIVSQFTPEAKHINENAFFLNYSPEHIRDVRLIQLEEYLDVISSREQLRALLSGETKCKPRNKFLDYYNPTFPNTIAHLKKAIQEL